MSKQTITLIKKIDAPVSVVFDALKAGQLLKSIGQTSGELTQDFRAGGEFRLLLSPEKFVAGRYLEITPNSVIKFSWNSVGCASSPTSETIVTITLKAVGTGSELTLIHEGLDAGACYEGHLEGWTAFVDVFAAGIKQPAALG